MPSPYRDRLATFYERYAPAKLRQVDAQLQKYAGREEDFFAALVQKYGPEPAVAAAVAATPAAAATPATSSPANRSLALAPAGAPSPYRDRLATFYERYAPAKLR
ncbi:uncharacterized protein Tco025E_02137, partial [Trypanosoma conorhini]